MIVAVTLEALAESFALAKTFGADFTALREVLLEGFSAGPLLEEGRAADARARLEARPSAMAV